MKNKNPQQTKTLNKKTILIVTTEFPPQPGGIGNHAFHLADQLASSGFTVQLIADQRDASQEELDFDAGLNFQVTRIRLNSIRFRMYIKRIKTCMQMFKQADIVIATGKFSLWNVAYCRLFHKAQTLAVLHGSEVNLSAWYLRKLVALALKRFDNLIAVSNYTKSLVYHVNQPITVIPNGIDTKSWQADGLSPKPLLGTPVLTTVGRVSSRKGQAQVIKILPALLAEFPDIHYHCVGIPTEAENFKALAATLGVGNHVTFHGALNSKALQETLLATDIFVMLSAATQTGDVEGFGIAILEANALGVPAIGTLGCGIEDAIKSGETGFLIKPNDADSFLKAINTLLADRIAYSNRAKKWALKHDWPTIINQYIALFK